ncbi:hypothetical protein PY257_01905 [Ramlibacter sp. H39-3-26]|uniref:hypothetical protein n=1 Tax=Curvibacter soli TaxID=3031331 RepID=UPI0023DC5713|nr:hypothetical protein [Ramlibacter sp. H39-3-26]MDF1483951.1 hypothetical protein [Ramlibacter sp. H39-3-26]
MKPLFAPALRGCIAAACMAAWLAAPAPAQAAGKTGKTAAPSSAQHKSGKKKKDGPRSHADETREQRERRLQRECQGRPNAGACMGYAS